MSMGADDFADYLVDKPGVYGLLGSQSGEETAYGHHHEKFDGSGYPNRLRGHDIPYLARVCSIVDAFDAMTSRRSYRDVIPLEKVVEELKKYSGTQFDPRNFVCFFRYC